MGRTGDSLVQEFPPRSGGRTPRRHDPLVGRKRGDPRVRWLLLLWLLLLLLLLLLLNLIISLRIIIVEPGGPRRMTLAAGISYILQKVFVKSK